MAKKTIPSEPKAAPDTKPVGATILAPDRLELASGIRFRPGKQGQSVPNEDLSSRWAILAGLRFFLATIVVFTHVASIAPQSALEGVIAPWNYLGGYYAVLGFFLISGFSIASSVQREPAHFYKRRFWRLAPVYWVCFALAFVPFLVWHTKSIVLSGTVLDLPAFSKGGIASVVLNAICLQCWITWPLGTFGATWSLACEAFYYYLAPKLVRLTDRKLVLVALGSIVIYYLHAHFRHLQFSQEKYGWATFGLAWAWIAGLLLYRNRNSNKFWLILLPIFTVLACTNKTEINSYGWLTCLLVFACFLPALKPQIPQVIKKTLLWLGDVSYPLYLCHLAVLLCVVRLMHHLPAYGGYLMYACCVIVGTLIYYLVDLPARRLVRKNDGAAVTTSTGSSIPTVAAETVVS